MTPSLEGWPTKADEPPSLHEVRLDPLDTNQLFQSLSVIFALLPFNCKTEKINWKIKNSKKWKKLKGISSFYTSVPKIKIIGYIVPEIWHVTDVIIMFHFWLFFALLIHYQPKKWKFFKKWKKHLEISLFYTTAPKIMTICYTVPEIWDVTHVIFIFIFGLFFGLSLFLNKKLKIVVDKLI